MALDGIAAAESGGRMGRPRDPRREEAILEATRALLGEGGFEALTIEGIAARASVGKQTIYRRWGGKAELVFAAFRADAQARVAIPDTGSLDGDLEAFLVRMVAALRPSADGLRALMAQAQLDPAFRRDFDRSFVASRRAALAALIARHAGQEAPSRARAALAIDMVYGAIWYRLLLGHAPLNAKFARDLAHAVAGLVR